MDKESYSVGVQLGGLIKDGIGRIDMEVLQRGLMDAANGKGLALDEGALRQAFMAFQQAVMAKQQTAAAAKAEQAKPEGEAFLEANAKKEGVVVLPSGLQYKVNESGTGETPGLTDKVSAHYRGMLVDDTEFDSSYKRGKPTTFPVNGVIAGWTEALQLMQVGDKWELYIPYNLAYGVNGNPRAGIAGYSALKFEIELVAVNPED